MKNNFVFPLVVLIAGSIVAGLAVYYLTRKNPDVRYTLSDSIPVSFQNPTGNTEIIQQLKVRNSGNESAKNIQVKINSEITSNELNKHSNADEVKIYNQNRNFELLYPELPPQGEFVLTLKSQGSEINKSNLNVSYNLGTAQEAFVKRETNLLDYILIPLNAVYVLVSIISIFQIITKSKESNLKYESVDKLLKMKRSWYIRESKWKKFIESALNYQVGGDYNRQGGLKFTESYILLSSDKPDYIDEDSWNNLVEKATKRLKELYNYNIGYSSSKDLINLLRESKPTHLKEIDWNELINEANKKYVTKQQSTLYEPTEIIWALKQQRPEEIKEEFWDKLIVRFRDELIDRLKHQLYINDAPYSYLQNLDLSVLDEGSQLKLKKSAYEKQFDTYNSIISLDEAKTFLSLPKPDWIKDPDYASMERRATKIVEIEEQRQKFKEWQREEEAQNEDLRRKYQLKFDNLSKDAQKLVDELENVSTIKQKIENQLEIINIVVNEPEKMERIEDYSHSFAPGNFENLKKLAELKKANSAK